MTAFVLNCVCFHKPQVWDRWAASLLFYEVPYVCMTAFVLNCVCFRKLQVWDRWGAGFPDTLVASARTPLAQMLATPPGEGEKNERIREWKKMRKRRWHAVRLNLHAPCLVAGYLTW